MSCVLYLFSSGDEFLHTLYLYSAAYELLVYCTRTVVRMGVLYTGRIQLWEWVSVCCTYTALGLSFLCTVPIRCWWWVSCVSCLYSGENMRPVYCTYTVVRMGILHTVLIQWWGWHSHVPHTHTVLKMFPLYWCTYTVLGMGFLCTVSILSLGWSSCVLYRGEDGHPVSCANTVAE